MSLTIEGVSLTDPQHVYVIAEASANHCRDKGKARALVEAAHEAGADAVKFQTFTADRIAAPGITIPRGIDPAQDAWLDRIGATTLRDVLAEGGLPWKWHEDLQALAQQCGITFLSTPFSLADAKFLVETLHVPALKIASGDITFAPLLTYAGQTGLPVILSTGGATLVECIDVLSGPLREAREEGVVVLLHCVSIYPAPEETVNLRAIQMLRNHFPDIPIGFSDHTLDFAVVPALAVSQGCCVYEKHLTLDRGNRSVDRDHSLQPDEFRKMVEVLRKAPIMLGNGEKEPHPLEKHDRAWARRSPIDWKRPTEKAREGAWEEEDDGGEQ